MSATLSAELNSLSPSEKLEVIESLWESLEATREVPVPAWHLEELQRRVAARAGREREGVSWPEVKARLLGGNA